jgi:hypothetical protein
MVHLKSLLKPILTKYTLMQLKIQEPLFKQLKPKKPAQKQEIKKRLPMSNPPKPLSQKERNKEIQRLEDYNKYLDSLLKDAISRM